MPLLYKDDWEEAKDRMRAFWAGEYMGRCGLAVCARRTHAPDIPEPELPASLEARWMDLDYLTACNHYRHETTFYGGEAFPVWHGRYPGHKSLDTFLGSPTRLAEETAWHEAILLEEDLDLSGLRIGEDNRFYRFTLAFLKRAVEESAGKSIPSLPAFGGSGDTLAALRGTERLLLDMAERPEQVRAADRFLIGLWEELYDRFYAILHEAAEGSTAWLEMWAPGKSYVIQNDFAYMISPRSFREVFLPSLEEQTRFLDQSIHHLDGEGNWPHAPALCELPRLRAIQIVPGDGKPSALHYLPMLKQIQAAGKSLQLFLEPREVETALGELSARRLIIYTSCETEAEAQELLRKVEKWSRE
jgi:hypothetical protein